MLPLTEAWPLLTLALLCLGVVGLCGLLWSSRQRIVRQLAALHRQVTEAAEAAAFGKRVDRLEGPAELNRLGNTINQLFDALSSRDAEMRQREALFRDLANTMPEVVLVHRERIIDANRAAADLVGLAPEQLTGRPVTDLVRPAYRALVRKIIDRRLAGDQAEDGSEIQLINSGERAMWVDAHSSLIDYRGQPAILTIARDITYRKSIEATLGRGKRQAQITLESIGEGVITADTSGLIDYMNAAAEALTGTKRDKAIGKRLADIAHLVDETDRRDLGDPVTRALTDRRRVNMGRRALLISRDGDKELSVELTASPIKGPADTLAGVVVIMHDVSEIRGLAQQMSYQAAHDALTGLINRREFERRMEQAMRAIREEGVTHVLCYLDLDRFKAVNDTCGHVAGDNMLREIAGLIKEQVRESDFVARLGGDEFGMLLIGCPLDKARQIGDDVCRAVADYRFVWQDRIFTVGVSVGLVEIASEAAEIKDLLAAADSACYIAKQQGRGQVHVYSARDEATARQRGEIYWLRLLQKALKENRFEIYSQPVVAVAANATGGPAMEILLRMEDEDGRLVLPAQFMGAAERYHLMTNIDRWVVRAALTALGHGSIRVPERRSCSINLSGQTLGADDFLEFVVECLDRTQVLPSQLCFEMSERAVMADPDLARRFVGVLHGIGCQFALDDFGSGVGSLVRLRDLGIDYLKIDGMFTRELSIDSVNRQVVTAVTEIAKTVGFDVIAEQVEDQQDFDVLRDLGVDFIQGHFISKPHPLGEAPAALSAAN